MTWDAIVLAGGRAERLGAADKAQVTIGGRTLLDRTLAAVAGANRTIVVGPGPVPAGVELVREDPPFGGPVAALAAGLPLVTAPRVLVTACDHPFLDVTALLDAEADGDGVELLAPDGRRQLVMVVWADALRAAMAALGEPSGQSVRALLARLDLRGVAAGDRVTTDVDTWADVERAEGQADD